MSECPWLVVDCVFFAVVGARVVLRGLEVGKGETVGIRHTEKKVGDRVSLEILEHRHE